MDLRPFSILLSKMCLELINKEAVMTFDQSLQNEGLPSALTELHERLVTSSHSDQMSMPVPIHILNTNEVQVIFHMR